MHPRDTPVVLAHAYLEDTLHGKTFKPRHRSRRRDTQLGSNHSHFVTHIHSQKHRQLPPQDNTEGAGLEIFKLTRHHVFTHG